MTLKQRNVGPELAFKKAERGELPAVLFDANYWKTQFHMQLAMKKSEHGALMLFEAPGETHRKIAEGYLAETPTAVTANERTILEWTLKPNQENHPLDCAVGCMVAASMAGITTHDRVIPVKQRLSLADLAARGGRA
jgi:hypothetical protein